MPTYDYACSNCGEFSLLRRMAERDQTAPCPQCGKAATRQLVYAPQLSLNSAHSQAAARNEQACHQPRCASVACHTAKPKRSTKTSPKARPWMLSH